MKHNSTYLKPPDKGFKSLKRFTEDKTLKSEKSKFELLKTFRTCF